MERWRGKVAIVTGTSSGIGVAIAENLVENGLKVVGLARRKERLEELKSKLAGKPGQFHPFVADITVEADILQAFKWAKENLGPIHVLINNAGVSRNTNLQAGATAAWKDVLDTNVLALSIATREALEDMKVNNIDGHIIHINSVLGHVVSQLPLINNMYTASKHAVTALSESLRVELRQAGRKIKVTSVSPGLVATEFGEAANFPVEAVAAVSKMAALKPEDLAKAVEFILSTPPHVQVHEFIVTAI